MKPVLRWCPAYHRWYVPSYNGSSIDAHAFKVAAEINRLNNK